MGWFTKRTTKWELQQSWLCILAVVFPIGIPFIAMLYMGFKAKIKTLLPSSLLYLVIVSLLAVKVFFQGLSSMFDVVSIVLWIGVLLTGPVVISMYLQSFLQRVDLKSIIRLQWSQSYDYVDFMRRNQISKVLSVSSFVDSLQNWQQIIENKQVQGNISDMIALTKEITNNNKHISDLFIERHAYSIENILEQYSQVERSKINNEIIAQAESKLKETLALAVIAFKEELSNQRNFRNMDIEVDAQIYLQDLKNKGIL
ncbi:hypothetical protein ACYSNM_08710 [Myroides sp. LJL116]